MNKDGDCYEVHGIEVIELSSLGNKTIILCHGQVWHPKLGYHGHSWLEDGSVCFDISNGHNICMRKEEYYKLGKIKKVKRYTGKQAAKHMLETETYGPWEKTK